MSVGRTDVNLLKVFDAVNDERNPLARCRISV